VEYDRHFLRDLRAAYRKFTRYFALPTDFMVHASGSTYFFHAVSLYALVRLVRPRIIVETGGTPGKSSAFLLRALQRNEEGHLYTIDLPPPQTDQETVATADSHEWRPRLAESNWCVADSLRERQTLLRGRAQEILPKLLRQLGQICMFLHDSDHSYEHFRWELEESYPFVRSGGYLWADDITTNPAWADFCAAHKLPDLCFTSQGATRKP